MPGALPDPAPPLHSATYSATSGIASNLVRNNPFMCTMLPQKNAARPFPS